MNRSEIKDFNKFKKAFLEKWGVFALSMYTQGLNHQVPEDMEDLVRQHNEEFDKAERFKTYQALKQEFEPEKNVYKPKKKLAVGDEVYVKPFSKHGTVSRIYDIGTFAASTVYRIKLYRGDYVCAYKEHLEY